MKAATAACNNRPQWTSASQAGAALHLIEHRAAGPNLRVRPGFWFHVVFH
jgi:hypothetical protein